MKKLVKLQLVHNHRHLKRILVLHFLNSEHTAEGTEVEVEIRNKRLKAVIIATPFYKR